MCGEKRRLRRLSWPFPFFSISLRANCPFYLRPHCADPHPTPLTPLPLLWRRLIGSGERQFVGVQPVVGLIAHGCWPGRKCLSGRGESLRSEGGAGVEVGIRNSGKHIVISHLTNPNQCCSALPLFKRTGSPPRGIQSPLLHPPLFPVATHVLSLTPSFISTLASTCSLADVGRSPFRSRNPQMPLALNTCFSRSILPAHCYCYSYLTYTSLYFFFFVSIFLPVFFENQPFGDGTPSSLCYLGPLSPFMGPTVHSSNHWTIVPVLRPSVEN